MHSHFQIEQETSESDKRVYCWSARISERVGRRKAFLRVMSDTAVPLSRLVDAMAIGKKDYATADASIGARNAEAIRSATRLTMFAVVLRPINEAGARHADIANRSDYRNLSSPLL